MPALIALLTNGRILACTDPRLGWRDTNLRLPNLKAPNITPLDSASFTFSETNGYSAARLYLHPNGRLDLHYVRNLPLTPRPFSTIAAVSESGRRIITNDTPRILSRTSAQWQTLIGPIRLRAYDEDPETTTAAFDRTERWAILCSCFRTGPNTSLYQLHIYDLKSDHSHFVAEIPADNLLGQVTQIVPISNGWFIQSNSDNAKTVYRLQMNPHTRRPTFTPYATGYCLPPALGTEIAILNPAPALPHSSLPVTLRGRTIGQSLPLTSPNDTNERLFHFPPFGIVQRLPNQALHIGTQPLSPPNGTIAGLFLLSQ